MIKITYHEFRIGAKKKLETIKVNLYISVSATKVYSCTYLWLWFIRMGRPIGKRPHFNHLTVAPFYVQRSPKVYFTYLEPIDLLDFSINSKTIFQLQNPKTSPKLRQKLTKKLTQKHPQILTKNYLKNLRKLSPSKTHIKIKSKNHPKILIKNFLENSLKNSPQNSCTTFIVHFCCNVTFRIPPTAWVLWIFLSKNDSTVKMIHFSTYLYSQ